MYIKRHVQFAIIIEDAYPFTSDVKVIRLVLAMFAPYTHTHTHGNGGEEVVHALARSW